MENPRRKWTSEEEEALRAGAKKHGAGKWKVIQKDPEFSPFFSSRSYIDLKDKWRHMKSYGCMSRRGGRGNLPEPQVVDLAAGGDQVPPTPQSVSVSAGGGVKQPRQSQMLMLWRSSRL